MKIFNKHNEYIQIGRGTVLFFLLLFFALSTIKLNAQDLIDQQKKSVRSSLYNFSYVDFNIDFYDLGKKRYLLSQTGNGVLKVNNNNYLNLEYNISNSWFNNTNYLTAGDFHFAYIHNFYTKNYLDKGFQGISTKIKVIIPTGKSEYSTGFDNWILEPLVYAGWKLKDKKTYFLYRVRLNFSISPLPGLESTSPYIRYEPIMGYENDKFWIASTGDNRLTLDNWEYTFLFKTEIGLKLSDFNGIFASINYRIIGDYYYKYYISCGYYKTF